MIKFKINTEDKTSDHDIEYLIKLMLELIAKHFPKQHLSPSKKKKKK